MPNTSPGAAASGEAVLPRWPVYIRVGDQPEVCAADVFADDPNELLLGIAGALHELAEYLEGRVRTP